MKGPNMSDAQAVLFPSYDTNFQNERSSDFQSMVHHSSHGGEICANHAALMEQEPI